MYVRLRLTTISKAMNTVLAIPVIALLFCSQGCLLVHHQSQTWRNTRSLQEVPKVSVCLVVVISYCRCPSSGVRGQWFPVELGEDAGVLLSCQDTQTSFVPSCKQVRQGNHKTLDPVTSSRSRPYSLF